MLEGEAGGVGICTPHPTPPGWGKRCGWGGMVNLAFRVYACVTALAAGVLGWVERSMGILAAVGCRGLGMGEGDFGIGGTAIVR